jgi:pimeloyl-ACP methyl ester carboxylesterase
MAQFERPDGRLHYTDSGDGDGAILIHGFAASAQENWGKSGWVTMLTRAKRRAVTLDLRGHGESFKLHDAKLYSIAAFADDVLALTDRLALKKPDLIGFSLGGRVVLELLARAPERFLLGVLCGAGGRWLETQSRDPEALPRAFEAEAAGDVPEGMARNFRLFADAQGQDRLALAAVARGLQRDAAPPDLERLRHMRNEILVIAGRSDELAGDPAGLAGALGNGKSVVVPGCGHMDCLVQPMFKGAVMDFLSGQPM